MDPGPPPDLPEGLEPLDDPALDALEAQWREAERAVRARLAPHERRLAAVRAGLGRLATERRRRERQRHLAARQQVRTAVRAGEAPSLEEVLAAPDPLMPDPTPVGEVEYCLETGGVVALGYPGSRQPTLPMTDGSQVAGAATLGEARALYARGWTVGVPAHPGVRVHTPGTRLERLLDAERCFVRLRARTA